ncbi:MAG: M1 family metallopeptidase [Deltaproteobacteria bacterium]|nr:M1 family metallopeptidase [Deltaproteobacteria bacterium]
MPARFASVVLGSIVALSCARTAQRQVESGKELAYPPSSSRPSFRLGKTIEPIRYGVDLSVIPSSSSFSGRVDIRLRLHEKTQVLWLNGEDLVIHRSELKTGGKTYVAHVEDKGDGLLGFVFGEAVGPGDAELHVEYEGAFSTKDDTGVFKQSEGNDWYVFTQFEPHDARRAFPCFDEPSFKAPWQVTLRVPRDHVALSNTKVASETDEGAGMRTVRFAETKPLPSYLIAFAVGPFDVVDAGKVGKNGVPLRIVTPRGRASDAAHAAAVTPELLALLESYFGTPYPFEKLDQVAVRLTSFGAMEHPGLITYHANLLIAPPVGNTIQRRRKFAAFCAHELAHQWFGNLVTLEWWEDTWLNESFAEWMATKIVNQWKPEWNTDAYRASVTSESMIQDSLVSARRIRQPILSHHDIQNAFDSITYDKGQAVLHMLESWIGPEKFQKGVQDYLGKHAFQNATAADFLAALSRSAGHDVAPAFSTFLDQVGVPLVTVALRCVKGKPPTLLMSQERYLPLGSHGSTDQVWQIPTCVRHDSGNGPEVTCGVLSSARGELSLGDEKCPDWVVENHGRAGYYRARSEGDLREATLKAWPHMTDAERVGALLDLKALMEKGLLPVDQLLSAVETAKMGASPLLERTLAHVLLGLFPALVPKESEGNFARFVRSVMGPSATSLGFFPHSGDDEETQITRPVLVSLVADQGEDKELLDTARSLAGRWLRDRKSIKPEMVGVVLDLAATRGDMALFAEMLAELRATRVHKERERILGALGSFLDPALHEQALAYSISGELDASDASHLFWTAAEISARVGRRVGRAEDQPAPVLSFLEKRFDDVVAALPHEDIAFLPTIGAYECHEKGAAAISSLFRDRAAKFSGAPRILAQSLEQIRLCAALRAKQATSMTRFLAKY